VRDETYHRQKTMGLIPRDTELPPRNPGVQAWAELTKDQKTVYARLEEVFAGFLDHADNQLGRLFAALDDMKIRDDTLIIVLSDNGASPEGLQNGTANTDRFRNYNPDTVEEMLGLLDKLGGPDTDPHYPMGWAMAGNAPLKRWKQDTHHGGNTDPLIISWPRQIKGEGEFRAQYHHVVDIVPTLLEITGLPAPTSVNGIKQMPLHGVSMAYTFGNADAPTRRKMQYYEMLGSRAIWADGWTAVTWHKKDTSWEDDRWELPTTPTSISSGARPRRRSSRTSCASYRLAGSKRPENTTFSHSTIGATSGPRIRRGLWRRSRSCPSITILALRSCTRSPLRSFSAASTPSRPT
jgi:arylsulfatase